MFKIQTRNAIAACGLDRFPKESYHISGDIDAPDAILLRSADLHDSVFSDSLLAIARAGAGTNNIPVQRLTERGVPVFNAPGANANAVKELVIAALFLAARNICQAAHFVRTLEAEGDALDVAVEAGKKRFVGYELPGRTLGVIGLGAIGVLVANTAHALGLRVLGFDPQITVQRAWQLSAGVEQAVSVEDLCSRSDFVTLHVPLVAETTGLIHASRLRLFKSGAALLNFARADVVVEDDVLAALDQGQLSSYICDFPSVKTKAHPRVVALPHLGASTGEAEDNCATFVADTLRDFLENGNVRNSVNFPEAVLPRIAGTHRLVISNANVPNMVGQISTALALAKLNIADLLNKSRGDIAYTIIDTDAPLPASILPAMRAISGVLSARLIKPPVRDFKISDD